MNKTKNEFFVKELNKSFPVYIDDKGQKTIYINNRLYYIIKDTIYHKVTIDELLNH